MSATLSATEARVHFGELLRRVNEQDEPVFIERDGVVRAVVVSPTRWAAATARGAQQEALAGLIALGDRLAARGGALPEVSDLIAQDREARDGALTDLR